MRKGYKDVLDFVGVDDLRGLLDRPETGEARDAAFFPVAKIADDAEAELAMAVHPLDERAGQLAIACDQDAIEVLARRMQTLHLAPYQHPSDHDEGDGQD